MPPWSQRTLELAQCAARSSNGQFIEDFDLLGHCWSDVYPTPQRLFALVRQKERPTLVIQSRSAPVGKDDLGVGQLAPLFLLTFALTLGLGAVLVIFPGHVIAIFGASNVSNPLYLALKI
jgi:hypothetical protein